MSAQQVVGAMLGAALVNSDIPVKAIAQETRYSDDAFYSAIRGERKLPKDARGQISMIHPLAGFAVALEATGYGIFDVITGDQHPQNILQRALKEDHEVDQSMQGMSWRLIDKRKSEDLTEEDRAVMNFVAKEMAEEIWAHLGVLASWHSDFGIDTVKILIEAGPQKREKPLVAAR